MTSSGIGATCPVDMGASDGTTIAESVINWLGTMKVSPTEYKMNETADATIFTTCFALFILDLFREVDKFTDEQKRQWISYIQSYQDEKDGYFKLQESFHVDQERSWHQLTCFCLSSLGILGSEPCFPLRFIERWQTPDDVRDYLFQQGCHEGRHTSGNKAMFLGIFLTYEYERTGQENYHSNIDAWFDFHDKHQNSFGFWGNDRQSRYIHGLQNGLHQFVVYFYWKRPLQRLERIVDVAILTQDRDGFFAPTPGGEGCHDYDAIHTLVMAHRISEYRRQDIEVSLKRAAKALRKNQNRDGGFFQSGKQVSTWFDTARRIPVIFSRHHPYLCYYRARKTLGVLLLKKHLIYTGWTRKDRRWTDSNLWDTWFRCLALAEIETVAPMQSNINATNLRFHKTIGLGFFDSAISRKG